MTHSQSIPTGGLISRKAEDIGIVLSSLLEDEQQVTTILDQEGTAFSSQIVFIDPERHYICLALSANPDANASLLARPRVSFISASPRWHHEFVASEPQRSELLGEPVIRMAYPSVVVSQERRRVEPRNSPRTDADAPFMLKCLANAHGIAPFEGNIIDISHRGIGFLLYQVDITLEPGTVLRGCRIERSGEAPISVDLEVRYSTSVPMPTGGYAHRSGCIFLNPTRRVTELIEAFNA